MPYPAASRSRRIDRGRFPDALPVMVRLDRIDIRIRPRAWEIFSQNRHGPARPGHPFQHGATTGDPDEPGHDGEKRISVSSRHLS